MALEYSVDLISDLWLDDSDQFDWTGKSTSLFCVVTGNISSCHKKITDVLHHLGQVYRGVLYIDGTIEHGDYRNYAENIEELAALCKPIENVIYMHNHVVILNSIAFIGINGWYGQHLRTTNFQEAMLINSLNNDDVTYLGNTIRGLQLHKDAKKLVVISNSIPSTHFTYGAVDDYIDGLEPGLALTMDTDHKVTHWLFGGSQILCDTEYHGRRYVNNPAVKGQPYWPKRIVI